MTSNSERLGDNMSGTPSMGEASRAWHRPVITRLNIERTLFGSGPELDGGTTNPGASGG